MGDDVFHVPKGGRVRFGRQTIDPRPAEDAWRVVRVIASRRPSIEGAGAMGRVLVAFRMSVRYRDVLATLAYSSDRALGRVVERLLDLTPALPADTMWPSEITAPRGRPSEQADNESFNQVVEIQEAGESFSTQIVGHWVDQLVYLLPAHIDRLEAIAKEAGLSADQALDAILAQHLARSLGP
jgi:hypothetical protein